MNDQMLLLISRYKHWYVVNNQFVHSIRSVADSIAKGHDTETQNTIMKHSKSQHNGTMQHNAKEVNSV